MVEPRVIIFSYYRKYKEYFEASSERAGAQLKVAIPVQKAHIVLLLKATFLQLLCSSIFTKSSIFNCAYM